MPTFNRSDYILESLNSIVANMSDNDEIIVIDDGSIDQTPAILDSYSGPIQYIRQDNAGKSVALNNGLSHATGRYVWITDDDDILNDGVVDRLVGEIEHTGCDIAFGKYTRFETTEGEVHQSDSGYWPDLTSGSVARHMLEDHFIFHNAALVHKSAYDRIGKFDTELLRSQDTDMFLRLVLTSSVSFVNADIFMQRQHSGVRGPAKAAHDHAESKQVWNNYDRDIYRRLREKIPLTFYESMFEASSESLHARAALLQRACVMGRHNLWDFAIEDFRAAMECRPAASLHPLERDICVRSVNGKYGFSGLIEQSKSKSFRKELSSHPVGREILGSIANGLVWQLRKESSAKRRDAVRYFFHYGIHRTLPALLSQRFVKSSIASKETLVERSQVDKLDADRFAIL